MVIPGRFDDIKGANKSHKLKKKINKPKSN
jgi:hypothetical protein